MSACATLLASPKGLTGGRTAHAPKLSIFANQAHRRATTHLVRSRGNDEGATGSEDFSVPDTLPLVGADSDWRDYRAKLVASTSGKEVQQGRWAHEIAGLEQGCILLAHPLMFGQTQTYFSHAVILIHECTDEYAAGIILNKPTQLTVEDAMEDSVLCPEFSKNEIYLGGDVGPNSLHLLHARTGLEGSIEVSRGLYYGGFQAAKDAVEAGTIPASDFRWYTRYAGWGPGQLQSECERKVWFCASVAPELLLAPCDGTGRERWHEILDLMGGDHAALSSIVRAEYTARSDLGEES